MATSNLNKQAQKFVPKQILLTLTKDSNGSLMTTVITPIRKNSMVKVGDKKLIRVNSEDGRNKLFKKTDNFGKFITSDRFCSTNFQQVSMKNKNSLSRTERSLRLNNLVVSKLGFYRNFSKLLCKRRETNKSMKIVKPLETDLRGSGDKNLASNSNKQDRFIPNILRSTRATDNTLYNNSLIGFVPIYNMTGHGTDNHCKDNKNVKRKRKQILRALDVDRDLSRKIQMQCEPNEFNKLLVCSDNYNSVKREATDTPEATMNSAENKDDHNCSEIKLESLVAIDEPPVGCSADDIYSADINIPCQTHNAFNTEKASINCRVDKSIKKILAEFEVADYQNYIDSEDVRLYIDEMDKLLSSDINSPLTDSSTFDHVTGIEKKDVNGNNIDNRCDQLKKSNSRKRSMWSGARCKIKSYYDDRMEQRMKTSGRLECCINFPRICCSAWNYGRSYNNNGTNSYPTGFDDYYSTDDFYNSHRSLEKISSSTDTASECDTNEFDSTWSLTSISPKTENLGCSATLLPVTDMVPDNFLDDDSNASCSDGSGSDHGRGRQKINADSMMQDYDFNPNDLKVNGYYTSLPGVPLDGLSANFNPHEGFDMFSELFEDGYFLRNDIQSIDSVFSKEDESCESILANSEAKFDEKYVSNMHSDEAEIDVETIDDIETSQSLGFGITKDSLSNFESQHDNEQSTQSADKGSLTTSRNNCISNYDNAQFSTTKFENSPQQQTENICQDIIYSNSEPSSEFSITNEVKIKKQESNAGDKEHEHSDLEIMDTLIGSDVPSSPRSDAEAKDLEGTESSGRFSPQSLIQKRNIEFESSELKRLLTGTQRCVDYPAVHDFSAMPCNVHVTYSKITRDERCLLARGSEDNILDSTVSSHEFCQNQMTDHSNIEDTSSSNAVQSSDKTDRSLIIITEDKFNIAQKRDHNLLESDLKHNRGPCNCQLVSHTVSTGKAAPPGKPVNAKKSNQGMRRDILKIAKRLKRKIFSIPCDFCDEIFGSEVALARHIQVTHGFRCSRFRYRDKKYVCNMCSKEYSIYGAMKRHFKLHDDYVLTCNLCEKHFSEKIFLRRHMQGAHSHWNIECRCGRKFPRKNELTRHLKNCYGSHGPWTESYI